MQLPENEQEDYDRLIGRIKEGDRDALRRLYEETARAVYSYALSIIRDPRDAEEIMQDVYLTAWQKCGGYAPSGKPMAWLFTIARNLCYIRLRARASHPSVSLDTLREQDSSWEPEDPDSAVEQVSDRQALLEALAVLEEQDRSILLLHILGGMKHREIAEELGLPLSTVLSRYSRAVRKVRNNFFSKNS